MRLIKRRKSMDRHLAATAHRSYRVDPSGTSAVDTILSLVPRGSGVQVLVKPHPLTYEDRRSVIDAILEGALGAYFEASEREGLRRLLHSLLGPGAWDTFLVSVETTSTKVRVREGDVLDILSAEPSAVILAEHRLL